MEIQQTLSEIEYSNRNRKTKREKFLEKMDKIIPWDAFIDLIQPYYYKGERGRPPIGIEKMLRMYFLQAWYSISDEKIEDEICDSYAFRTFMGINFLTQQAPDATTLCTFRKILEENAITIKMFSYITQALDDNGLMMHGGSIVDATIIAAPTSTKNEKRERDPKMGSTKKNGQYYFGAKLHTGTDAGSGFIYDFETTAANVHDINVAHELIRRDDEVFYGDAAYIGLEKREEMQADFPNLQYRTNVKRSTIPKMSNGQREYWAAYIEARKSAVRNKAEHPFHIIKNIFGFRKTPYKGLLKLEARFAVLCMSANLYMCAQFRKITKPLFCLTPWEKSALFAQL
jgi:IS5 family transposase